MTLPAGFLDRPFAHRGLWSPGERPENSLPAFAAAAEAGYGVELDVMLSADGEAVVFHDETLERMTAQSGLVEERPVDVLTSLRLMGSDHTIPTLAQALATIGGRVPMLIELKSPCGQEGLLEKRVLELVAGHNGPYAFISFNPHALAWMAVHDPATPRGLSALSFGWDPHASDEKREAYRRLEQVPIADPHFLVLNLDLLASAPARRLRAGGLPVIAWTVRRPTELETAAWDCDSIIFEDMMP